LTEKAHKTGLDLPRRVRQSLAAAVVERGPQARAVSTQGRESMRPPRSHVIVAAEGDEIEGVRGPARVVRRLEHYKTPYGPVIRLALSVYPQAGGEPLSAATLLNISQVSGDAAIAGLGRQRTLHVHFYRAEGGNLSYAFSKELTNGAEQRAEARKVLKMARDAYAGTPEGRRSFRWAVGLAEKRFELPVPEPEMEA
jgi:hypothetical protein